MRALILTLLVGCFSPHIPKAPCADNDACPDDEACVYGVCGGDDSDAPVVAFAMSTLAVDETVGTVTIPIVLSKPPLRTVTVHYGVAGGTATRDVDYSTMDQTLTFAPGQTEQDVSLAIVLDSLEEPEETIELEVDSPDGGLLGTGGATITIAANLLPRVSFDAAAVSIPEASAGSVMLTLDNSPTFPVTVNYTLSGTATGGGVDYTLAAGSVMFAVGSTSQQLALGIVSDMLDEDDETIVLTLSSPTNAFLGANPVETVTIVDDDATPTVSITTASGSVAEINTTVALTVALSAVSGRTVTVPFSAGAGSTATAGADYNYSTASPLTFPAGTTTKTINIAILADTVGEADETIVTNLGTPTNANLGATTSQTETILDDDRVCYGSGGSDDVCVAAAPTGAVTLPATINTGTSALCSATQPFGWTNAGQPAVCLIAANTIAATSTVTVTGTRPLVLLASDSITISALVDAASHRGGGVGPGSPFANCSAFPVTPQNGNSGAGGGAGGSFMSKGGNGGTGNSGGATAGTSPAASGAPSVLHAGCDGQLAGKAGGGSTPGAVGRGGGAVYLVAANAITIGTGGIIDVSGSAGSGGTLLTGGSGAGTGGMIQLYAPAINATGGVLIANGGGGASGGNSATSGVAGSDPSSAAPLSQAGGGVSGGTGGTGGAGFAGGAAATAGSAGSANGGGGGGGGGGGYILANASLTGATTSAGVVNAP